MQDTVFTSTSSSRKDMVRKPIVVGNQVEISGFYKPHDKFRVEVKFEYQLNREVPASDFLVEFYLFVPQALRLKSRLAKATDFFPDIKSYMRYAVQPMKLSDLCNLDNELSPLARVYHFVQTGKVVERKNQPNNFFIHEAKLATCIFKETIKGSLLKIESLLKKMEQDPIEPLSLLENFYHEAMLFQQSLLKLDALVSESRFVAADNLSRFDAVLEFYYFEMNLFFISIFELLQSIKAKGGVCDELEMQVSLGYEELMQFARGKKYIELTEASTEREKEKYIYRASKLKKYVSSILFLNRDVITNKKAEEFVFAMASAVAILWFLLLMAAIKWPVNSVPWITFVVLIYIVRDRIKDGIKDGFKRMAPTYLAHRSQKLIEEDVGKVGYLKEWLEFQNYNKMPQDILEARSYRRDMVSVLKRSEEVIHYKKIMRVHNEIINANHQRIDGIVNVLRFNLERFCSYMDDPAKVLRVVNDRKEIVPIVGKKMYHLNLIFKITSNYEKQNATSEVLKLKVVINRDGIDRIEFPYDQQSIKHLDITWNPEHE